MDDRENATQEWVEDLAKRSLGINEEEEVKEEEGVAMQRPMGMSEQAYSIYFPAVLTATQNLAEIVEECKTAESVEDWRRLALAMDNIAKVKEFGNILAS